ncbi:MULTISPECIES: VOC family protein [unclassified Nocardiopsis]|uniref:VOC family protein n=1 Tax=Nocardiopsis TaxID=2013 RepID=UPI00387B9CBF
MRMLHLGLRVTDLERSLAFYTGLGYVELGRLPDDPFVSLELVHDPARPVRGTGAVNHLVIQVDDLDAVIADLAGRGIGAGFPAEPGPGGRTSRVDDRDGHRVELVRWPPGRPAGMTEADFA